MERYPTTTGAVASPAVNRLESETSPYLRQHAANPVDWYPWGDEAFARARDLDTPILLSVGYSACHWCHVMAHESFEDAAVAEVINGSFVAVKVDREERPDVDAVYMEAVQAISGRGGWPMTVFMTPDGRPFFAGTYFPPKDSSGMPSFRRVLDAVDEAWRQRRPEVEAQADSLVDAVSRRSRVPADLLGVRVPADAGVASVSGPLLARALAELEARFDDTWGGFGPAPKFPQPTLVELCWRHHRLTGSDRSLAMATATLDAMAVGGIYDHLGGGFARYSTDETWTVPHFEKMLYDQAGLVRAYLHGWLATGTARWLTVVDETITYVLRDLASPAGGLYCAQDADSEGEEGRFYVWSAADIEAVLDPDVAAAAIDFYGVTPRGNFEGKNILRRPLGATSERTPSLDAARTALFEARALRVAPGLDDKILTEWNAMFCSALAEAAGATGNPQWHQKAVEIGRFLLDEMRQPTTGRLLRSWQQGRARHLAYAADYAWLVDCLTRLGELTGEAHWTHEAQKTAYDMLRLFGAGEADGEGGGLLFTTGNDAEKLVVRPVDVMDGATASANSVAAAALVRLGALCGDDALSEAGASLLALLAGVAGEHPLALANAVAAAGLVGGGVTEVVVTGQRPELVAAVQARFEPTVVLAWGEPTASPLWADRRPGYAHVCRSYTCASPTADSGELAARLDDARRQDAEDYLAATAS